LVARLVFLNAEKAGAAVNLGDAPVTIGRNPQRTIVYAPDEILVSNDHATITPRDGHYVIKDDGSRNHTLVNSEVVTEHRLEHGDLIQFGHGGPSARFVIEAAPGETAPDPSTQPHRTVTGSHRAVTGRFTSAMPAIVAGGPEEPEEATPEKRNRRNFLKLSSMVAGTATALLASIPAISAFVSPLFRAKSEGSWFSLGPADDFETGIPNKKDFSRSHRDAWVETRSMISVWVYTADNKDFAVYDARCTHLGCGYNFVKETGIFQCPCHGGQFDPKNGAVLGGPPPRPLDRIPHKVENGVLMIQVA
jgi:menaquinol-cytochrome c reductase iron-sulfur subunit